MQVISKKEQKSEQSKQKLLETTGDIIREYGAKYLTVRNVCEVSGVSSGSLYHHFGTKEKLICVYIENLFSEVKKANPIPDQVLNHAHLGKIIWPFLVFSKFCEKLGPETVRFLFSDCDHDIFEKAYLNDEIMPEINSLFLEGGAFYAENQAIDLNAIYVDLVMLYKGVIISWCIGVDKAIREVSNRGRNVCENMEHLIFRFLLSFAPDAYRRTIHFGDLIYEMEDFESFFDMSCVTVKM